jgi:osmotically-inducible protein OsmY
MTDIALRQDIEDELAFEPALNSANIGVAVKNGVATLTGHVPNFAQKHLAEAAAKRVRGVRGIAEEITVDMGPSNPYADEDIAKRAVTALDLNVLVPPRKIQVKVERGWITLSGEVEWNYQRTVAAADLRKLRGVVGLTNAVTLKARATPADVERRIREALRRNADVETDQIKVVVEGGKVKLEGRVHTWADREAVERAAWSAPGITLVEAHVSVA